MIPKISIIVPMFRVAGYIERCASTLLNQTLQEIEIIFVDDCSPDDSVERLCNLLAKQSQQRKEQVRILRNPQNRGTLQTRSWGMLSATGEYIMCVDADDWLDLDTCEVLYNQAKAEGADCIVFNYQEHYEEGQTKIFDRTTTEKSGKRFLQNVYRTRPFLMLCNMLIKNQPYVVDALNRYYNKKEWEGVCLSEDQIIAVPILYHSTVLGSNERAFYHYEKTRSEASSASESTERIHKAVNIISQLLEICPDRSIRKSILSLIFYNKKGLMALQSCKAWRETCPESNKYILQYAWMSMTRRIGYQIFALPGLAPIVDWFLEHRRRAKGIIIEK